MCMQPGACRLLYCSGRGNAESVYAASAREGLKFAEAFVGKMALDGLSRCVQLCLLWVFRVCNCPPIPLKAERP